MKRINSIDVTRGLVMIIMALDHVRDMMHVNAITQSPTDLATTTPVLFFTRWITHLCAPVFVFLAGTSAYLSFKRGAGISETRNFLLKRGAWLLLLEFTIVNFGLFFDPLFRTIIFEVIAAIGCGFIVLAFLMGLSSTTIGVIGLLIIGGHNLVPLIHFSEGSFLKTVLTPLFNLSAFPLTPHTTFIIGYPPIPWLGVMLTGFASGTFFELPAANRKRLFLKIGCVALLLFIAIRFINIYGDPVRWSAQKNGVYTFLSFMNITKYPPSLLFCLVTLGIMFLILAAAEGVKNEVVQVLSVYGKVPLFYFLVHFYLIHLITIALLLLQGFHWWQLHFASGTVGRPKGVTSGVGLPLIYGIWIVVVAVLYKPCRWYGKYKAEDKQGWLKYV